LEEIIFENFNISENNIIIVKLAKVLRSSATSAETVIPMGCQWGGKSGQGIGYIFVGIAFLCQFVGSPICPWIGLGCHFDNLS